MNIMGNSKVLTGLGVNRTITMTDIAETLVSVVRVSIQISCIPFRLYVHRLVTSTQYGQWTI